MHRTVPTLEADTATLSALLALVEDVVVISDCTGRITGWSLGAEQLLGYGAEEILGRQFSELYADDERALQQQRTQALTADDAALSFDTLLQTRSGELRAVQIFMAAQKHSQPDRKTVLVRILLRGEVGPRQRASATQLRESWELLDSLPIAFSLLDTNRRFLYLNRAARANLPAGMSEVIGKHLRDVFGERCYRNWTAQIDQVLSGVESSSEVSFPNAQGELRHFYRHLSPHRSADGVVQGYFSAVMDITATRITQEQQLRREQLLRSTLLREINHRIKNSLQGLIGMMRLHNARKMNPTDLIEQCVSQLMAVAIAFGLASQHGEARILLVDMVRDIARNIEQVSQCRIKVEVSGDAVRNPVVLSEQSGVNISLVINELIFNAVKHGGDLADRRHVRVLVERDGSAAMLQVINANANLPQGFSLASGHGLGTGLSLIKALVPPESCTLTIAQEGPDVIARLLLSSPLLPPQ